MNLSQCGLLSCQVNALTAMIPDLSPSSPSLPQGAIDLGQGYVLLHAQDRYNCLMHPQEAGVISAGQQQMSTVTGVQRLPNGLSFDFEMVRWLGLAERNLLNLWESSELLIM